MRDSLASPTARRSSPAPLLRQICTLIVLVALLGHARGQSVLFIRGDVEADSQLTITDAVRVLGFLFLGNPTTLDCHDAADADDSGSLEISDPIRLLNFLFIGGDPLPPPAGSCGIDPSADGLDCRKFLPCPAKELPRALFLAEPRSGPAPLAVIFDASDSTSPSGAIVSYEWHFGDGATAAGIQIEHTYSKAGTYAATLRVMDDAGTSAPTTHTIIAYACRPDAPILDPHPARTSEDEILITGHAAAGARVEVAAPSGVFEATSPDGIFGVHIPLVPAGLNRVHRISFRARTACGTPSSSTFTSITHDTQGPQLFVDVPADRARVTGAVADVAGRVGDVLSGFLGLTVAVNGVEAAVDVGVGPNGTFFARDVPLGPGGPVELIAVARDVLGNRSERRITVVRDVDPPGTARIEVLSGNGQTAPVHRLLPAPIAVRVTQPGGEPFAGKLVTFSATRSDGRLGANAADVGGIFLQTFTEADGVARAYWRLGTDAGCGNNRVTAAARDVYGAADFCASASAGPAVQLNISSGQNQRVEVGGPAHEPLRVWVSDGCNGVAGVPVTFTVRAGGGLVQGSSSHSVESDATGHAEVGFVLGPTARRHVIEADFQGHPHDPARFIVAGVVREAMPVTVFTGLVLDNAYRPIKEATCRLIGPGDHRPRVRSDADGQFRFSDLNFTGPAQLRIDGLTATHVAGREVPVDSFPSLHFETVITPLAENSLTTPVLLPTLDPRNARVYDGTRDVELTVAGLEGLRVRIRAGSMRRSDGTLPSPADPAILSLNQVHHDDVPMPMPDGAAPPFAWTLQPSGATFDPPAAIVYPNMSALAPGAVSNFLSFNHDTARFEIVASGRVSDDGAQIVSDPGTGIMTAGWGCNCPPYSVTGSCSNGNDDGDDGDDDEDDDDDDDEDDDDDKACTDPCDDGDPCTINDHCVGSKCQGESPLIPCSNYPAIPVNYDWPSEESNGTNATRRLDEGFLDSPCVDAAAGVWRRMPNEMNSYGIAFYTLGSSIEPNPVLGGNVGLCPPEAGQGCYCEIIADMRDYKGDPGTGQGDWHTLEASRAHEEYHAAVDIVALLDPQWAFTESLMRLQGIPCVVPPDVASDLLMNINQALFATMQANFAMALNAFADIHNDHPFNGGAYCAGQAVLDAKIAEIEAFAAAQGFPPCDFEPLAQRAGAGGADGPLLVELTAAVPESLLDPGATVAITVEGRFADGSRRDLTSAASGTTYHSGNSAVATVDADGRVAAMRSGVALITADHPPGASGDLPLLAPVLIRVRSPHDSDGDLLPSVYEVDVGLDPEEPSDAHADRDGDGIDEIEEFFRRTNPLAADSDGDGIEDGREVKSGGDPRTPMRLEELDESWVLVAGGQAVEPLRNGRFRIDNIAAADLIGAVPGGPPDFLSDDPVRVLGVSTRSGVTRFAVSEPFRIRQGETYVVEKFTISTTPPPGLPESMVLVAGRLVLTALDETLQLQVIGTTSDGATEDLTPSSRLTVYRSSNPSRLAVTPDGLVTVLSLEPGNVFITATNQGVTAVLRLRIELPIRPMTVVGFVQRENGSPVAGAQVGIAGDDVFVLSRADGSFSFDTLAPTGSELAVRARIEIDGRTFTGTAIGIVPSQGAFTDAGTIVISPFCPPAWDMEFLAASQGGPIFALEVFDDGSGQALYAAGSSTRIGGVFVQGGIARWNGVKWSAADAKVAPGVRVLAALDLEDGNGPALYCGGTRVWRWSGSEWLELGQTRNADVFALAVFDGGAGPALHAGMRGGVARWDGQTWTLVAPGWTRAPNALALFDDGRVTDLYAGGLSLQSAGETFDGVARWDGTRWSALGSGLRTAPNRVRGVLSLGVFDDGSGSSLFAGGEFTTAGALAVDGIARWDGEAWNEVGGGIEGPLAEVAALAPFDDGTGPALYAAGRFKTAGMSPAGGMARWNGSQWSALGTELEAIYVWAIEPFDDGSGPALYFAGHYTAPDGAGGGQGIVRWHRPRDCR